MSKLRKPPRKMRKLQMKSNPAYFVKRNVGLTRAGMEPVEARDGDKFCNGIYIGEENTLYILHFNSLICYNPSVSIPRTPEAEEGG